MNDYNEIIEAAYRAMKANRHGMRGQTLDPQYSIEWWIVDTALNGPCKACETTAVANDHLKAENERLRFTLYGYDGIKT